MYAGMICVNVLMIIECGILRGSSQYERLFARCADILFTQLEHQCDDTDLEDCGMTDKELKKLSREELLELLIAQGRELESCRQKLAEAEEELASRRIAIDNAGSIAEASLQLNGVFEAAQRACAQYTDNIRLLSQRQQSICHEIEEAARIRAEQMISDTQKECDAMRRNVQAECAEMLRQAKNSQAAAARKQEAAQSAYYALRELLTIASPDQNV